MYKHYIVIVIPLHMYEARENRHDDVKNEMIKVSTPSSNDFLRLVNLRVLPSPSTSSSMEGEAKDEKFLSIVTPFLHLHCLKDVGLFIGV